MNLAAVRPVVDAVLYEGYILYPYRAGSAKNRQRWTFGGIYPRAYAEATGTADPDHMQTQCLLEGDADTRLEVQVRFLQPIARQVGQLAAPLDQWPAQGEPEFTPVRSLVVGEQQFHSWQEAMERDVAVAECRLGELLEQGRNIAFDFAGQHESEPLKDEQDRCVGLLLRTRSEIHGAVDLRVETVAEGLYRLSVRIENYTPMDPAAVGNRDEASLYSFASTHTVLGVEDGAFVSLMDPPQTMAAAAAACDNHGAWPVLIGREGARDTLLASPIILYDYPQVAPESPGDLYDATEIDEILSLNILAMTDDEKREMAATDPRAAALLARTEALDGDDFMRLHGTMRDPRRTHDGDANPLEPATDARGPHLAWYNDGTTTLKIGDHVCLHPKAGGDVMDIVLDGKAAVIESIERDFEDRIHVAVALDDDPGRDWGMQRMHGHRFFFSPEEIESLEPEAQPQREQQQ